MDSRKQLNANGGASPAFFSLPESCVAVAKLTARAPPGARATQKKSGGYSDKDRPRSTLDAAGER